MALGFDPAEVRDDHGGTSGSRSCASGWSNRWTVAIDSRPGIGTRVMLGRPLGRDGRGLTMRVFWSTITALLLEGLQNLLES